MSAQARRSDNGRGQNGSCPSRQRTMASVRPREHVADVQRARLLGGAVRALDECGYGKTAVGDITRASRMSRRTFYELFASSEDCFVAVLDGTVDMVRAQLAQAVPESLPWRERVRVGLWTILSFLDREPMLARVCVVQLARGGRLILERREQIFRELTAIVEQGHDEATPARSDCTPLTAEGIVGAAMWMVYARLLRGELAPLTDRRFSSTDLADLTGELMSMIVLPYLGAAAARRERACPLPKSQLGDARHGASASPGPNGDPLHDVPLRLTYRTVRVLATIAEHPGSSNRRIGVEAGATDQGQISKLLARLQAVGLIENTSRGWGHGEQNAWRLTKKGEEVHGAITEQSMWA